MAAFSKRAARGWLLGMVMGIASPSLAQSDPNAVQDVEALLRDPAARAAFSAGDPAARSANDFLLQFPSWAQDEIIAINVAILKESGMGAARHTQAYQNGGAPAAMASFSPAIQARVQALVQRLEADPAFRDPTKREAMRRGMPRLLGAP